jgi:hypothetical protein
MSLFARKYLRDGPGAREKAVGALILVLLGLIIGTFLLTGGLLKGVVARSAALVGLKKVIGISEEPLFVAGAGGINTQVQSAELRFAAALLPRTTGVWVRHSVQMNPIGRVQEAGVGGPSASLVQTFARCRVEYGADHLAHAVYRRNETEPSASVWIIAAADSASAFGLCHAGRPDDSQPIEIGCGGWQVGKSVRWWAGRHCLQVDASSLSEACELAGAIASGILTYGRPFWSEMVLPGDGRIAESLRYHPRNALGIDGLNRCWLADYEDGITITVARLDDVQADSVLETLGRTTGESSSEGEHTGAVAGRRTAAVIVTSYVFVVLADDDAELEKRVASLRARWEGPPAVAPSETEVTGPMSGSVARFVEVEGLDSPAEIERYTDNLYEKIDGREPQFRAYHFVELRFGRYSDVGRKETFDAYIFDMAAAANAFGIYAKERSGVSGSVDIGRAGYQSGAATFFCKGKYYVYVLGPADGGEAASATSRRVAESIADTIAGVDEPFWAETLLPVEDQLANTLSYQATSALSYEFLEGVFLAKYKTDDVPYQMFLMKAKDEAKAKALFGRLAEKLAKSQYDKIVSRGELDGGETLVCDSLGYFLVAFRTGVYLGGVIECEDRELASRQAEQLRKRVAEGVLGGGEDG